MGPVRQAVSLPLLLLLAGCADRVQGKTAAEWAAELADPGKGEAALGRLGDAGAAATGVLVEILETTSGKPPVMAASLLARLGPEAAPAVPALARALQAEDRRLRGMAAIALGRVGEGARDALVPLNRALSDRDVRVRVAASLAIYGITGDTAAPTRVLFTALTSDDPDVRAMVAEAFDEMGTPILDMLVRSLGNADPATRASAAKTLGAMGPSANEALPSLYSKLKDPEEAVRAAVANAIERIDG